MNSGLTRVAVKDADSNIMRGYECPQTSDQYLTHAARDVLIVDGLSSEYVAWVDQRLRKQGK